MKNLFEMLGFENTSVFIQVTFHPENTKATALASILMGIIATFFEGFIGFEPMVGIALFGLFFLELFTGIKASIKEGNKFESRKFGRAFVKLGVYLLMIGFANLLAQNMKPKSILGMEFNYYEWIHYALFNFVILNMFISNIENSKRLGWEEFVPILGKISSWLKIK